MTRILTFVLAVVGSLTLSAPVGRCQGQRVSLNHPAGKSRRPSVTVVRQQSSPVTLKVSSVESIDGKPGLVKVTIKAQGIPAVRGYHFHYEETFVDGYGAGGAVVTDSTSLRSLSHEETFIAHENAEIEVWVSEVEFLDGATWKSALTPKSKREGK